MQPRVDFLTFATADLEAARSFYRDGLGWQPLLDVPGEIIFFQVGHALVLGLFDADHFADDLGKASGPLTISGVTLSHNVGGPEEVREVVERAVAAGARLITQPREAAFGGYHGHFADPNGIVWEVAHNAGWSVDDSGAVSLAAVVDP
jgi:catechol 2,3-dioxygenase-like lactoylglutathione lyase family enzyme